ncbi:Short-chain dehydrogenase/reductase SDR [Trinorchestia longiramus]|nr:Short-chain dehydrogenase/reductase SDR [Trinorchestia longiramus]
MRSFKFWPNQWLYIAAFVASMDIMMTVRKFYFINVICSGAFSIIFGDICVKAYEVFVYKRKFLEDTQKKAVLVTGCDTGFGFLFAQKLAKMGFLVYATVLDRNSDGAKTLETHNNIVVVALDVTKQASIDQVVEFVTSDVKKRDRTFWCLVNNAGVAIYCDVEFAPMDHYQHLMDVNVFGAVRMCKSFLPLLRAAGNGRIVNIASQSSKLTLPCMTAYSMSKNALTSFSNGLRLELKPWNISVHTIEPMFYLTTPTVEDLLKHHNEHYMKLWHSAPNETKQAYGDSYRINRIQTFKELTTKYMKPKEELYEVVDDVVHAVAGIDPNVRYTPSTRVKILMKMLSFLPQELVDKIINPEMKELPAGLKNAQLSPRTHS